MADILPPTIPLQVADSLADELSDVACGYSQHRGNAPARWAVWFRPLPCGHKRADFLFFCDPCWRHRTTGSESICNTGQHVYPVMYSIVRVEQI